MKILVVDDDELILQSVSFYLEEKGYRVISARDGMEALKIIQNEKPDLIISDILMPNMSGLSLLSLLKQFYFNTIPVILISALDQQEVVASAVSLGAQDFIFKPLNLDELFLRVKKFDKKKVNSV